MRQIKIIDTTLRDAHQCLWSTRMRTAHMLPIAETMDRAGFSEIDLMGAIQFDVCIRYLREDPWERVRLVRDRIKQTPLRALIRSNNLLNFAEVPKDIINLWIERLWANGCRVIGSFDGLNDVNNIASGLIHAKKLGAYTFGALSFSESPVHSDELYIKTAKDLIQRCKVDAIMLKDASGLLTVDRARTLIPKLKKAIGKVELELHSHCLTGLAPLVYLESVKLGVDAVHVSVSPLANGAAQPATQTQIRNLRSMGYMTSVDDSAVDEISKHFTTIAERINLPVGMPAEYDSYHFEHQIPGGMLSNFKSQLEHAGLSHKFPHLLEECAQIRRELAWPIMITPFAQLVGTQAVLNVVHGERYRVVPDEVKKYSLGYYGALPAAIDPNVLDKIIANGSSAISEQKQPLQDAVADLRKKYPTASDEERLLRFMLPKSEVDAMHSAPSISSFDRHGTPVLELIKILASQKGRRHIYVRKADFVVEMKKT